MPLNSQYISFYKVLYKPITLSPKSIKCYHKLISTNPWRRGDEQERTCIQYISGFIVMRKGRLYEPLSFSRQSVCVWGPWGYNCRNIRNLDLGDGNGSGGHIKDMRRRGSRPYRPRRFNIHESFLPFYRPLSANIRRLNTHVIIITQHNRHKKL